jgi:CHASE3 domain sensor protein
MLIAAGIASVVAVGALLAGTLAIAGLTSARRAVVDQFDPALLNTQALVGSLLNQETAVRGFVITGNPTFLEPDEQGRRQQATATNNLRALAANFDWTDLTARLDAVTGATDAWRAQYADPTIAAVRTNGARAANVDPTGGKAEFDDVRTPWTRSAAS